MTLRKISVRLYLVSLIAPIFFGTWDIGLIALLMGWMGVVSGEAVYAIPWLANFIFFATFLFKASNRMLLILLNSTTVILALVAFGIRVSPRIEGNQSVVVGIGFFIWILSFILKLIGDLKTSDKPSYCIEQKSVHGPNS